MLLPPDDILEENKDKSYIELLEVRDELIREIRKFEKRRKLQNGEPLPDELASSPSADTVYEYDLESLGLLCKLISEKHNEECNARFIKELEELGINPTIPK